MDTVFDKNWFKKEQNRLLWLLNHSTYFRRDLGIQECDLPHGIPITEITPNSFSWGDRYFQVGKEWRRERTTDFRGTNKFSNRMYYAFYPVWNIAHKFDLSLANRYAPSLNLGFDTLTQYPGSTGTGNPIDGRIYVGSKNESWSTIIAEATATGFTNNPTADFLANFQASSTSNQWAVLHRSIFCFVTSTITSSATISAATLSLNGTAKADPTSNAPTVDVYTSNPANTNGLEVGDFDSLGTSSQTGAPIAYNSFSTTGYNDFTFNATGISNISKIGISKFGVRIANYDVSGTSPTWASNANTYFVVNYSGASGTTSDPKLVVTYSSVVGPANLKSYNTNLKANIKSINTNLIANCKSLNTNS